MFDRFAKEKYDVASTLLNDVDGEDIRTLFLRITIEISTKKNEKDVLYSEKDFTELSRLAEALLYRIVSDKSLSIEQIESVALVCAYAYEILSPSIMEDSEISFDSLLFLNRITAALLYHIAGYDSNAKSIIKPLKEKILNNDSNLEKDIMLQFCDFSMLLMREAIVDMNELILPEVLRAEELGTYATKGCLLELNKCINLISREFTFIHERWNFIIDERLTLLVGNAMKCNQQTVAILTLLLEMFSKNTSKRAISVLKNPGSCNQNLWKDQMDAYLQKGIYLIWPPHVKAIQNGLFEDDVNGILSIPTGTGKSLIAEHKIITKLKENNLIIYLAPTHALCRQIVKSLSGLIEVYQANKPNIFINDRELEDIKITHDATTILVLTPEKCTSLLTNNIELIEKCSLCIVDEFHNLYKDDRGAILDLLLSKLAQVSDTNFFVMSALIEDEPDEIIAWLKKLNGNKVSTVFMKWRPTRTIRGFVAHPESQINMAIQEAQQTTKKSYSTKIQTQILFCVEDVWEKSRKTAYHITLPIKMNVRLKYEPHPFTQKNRWHIVGYGNDLARQIGNYLSKEMSVIIFSQGTRHLLNEIEKHEKLHVNPQTMNDISLAYLRLANEELGYESELNKALINGIGIHTQALIQEEQEAVEEFFKDTNRGLLCATGTISQGLNLAASAVVVNTTKQYNEDGSKPLSKAEVINMLGRAGRPGFGHQSLGLIVPQYPATTSDDGFNLDNESKSYLERIDGSEETSSGLLDIYRDMTSKELKGESLDDDFALILNVLGEGPPKLRRDLLSKTLASQFVEEKFVDKISEDINKWSAKFNDEEKTMILQAANKSSNKISIIQTIFNNIKDIIDKYSCEDISQEELLNDFFNCIRKFDEEFIKTNVDDTFKNANVMIEFFQSWIKGATILELAEILNSHGTGILNKKSINRSNRSSVAKAIKVTSEGVRNLSHLSLGYVSLIELFRKGGKEVPEGLFLLPSYLKYGVNNSIALKLRMRGIPRKTAINLSKTLQGKSKISLVVKKWKREKKINGLSEDLSSAIIRILK
ncbi:DEAD/DEAH box helicase [Lysinibacillus fusiformis]